MYHGFRVSGESIDEQQVEFHDHHGYCNPYRGSRRLVAAWRGVLGITGDRRYLCNRGPVGDRSASGTVTSRSKGLLYGALVTDVILLIASLISTPNMTTLLLAIAFGVVTALATWLRGSDG